MKRELDSYASDIQNVESILRIIKQFSAETKNPLDVLVLMESLQMDYPVEYYRYKLFQLLPSFLQPAIQTDFHEWNPLTVGVCLVESFIRMLQSLKNWFIM